LNLTIFTAHLDSISKQHNLTVCKKEEIQKAVAAIANLNLRPRERRRAGGSDHDASHASNGTKVFHHPSAGRSPSFSLFHSPFNCQRVIKLFSMPRTPMSEKAFYSFLVRRLILRGKDDWHSFKANRANCQMEQQHLCR
jgi:hypothetical protein